MSLTGKSIALLEARMSGELSSMVERLGGTPYSVPAVRETPLEQPEETARFVDGLCAGRFHVVVFMTGVGATALLARSRETRQARRRARGACASATTVCRGPKPGRGPAPARRSGQRHRGRTAHDHRAASVARAPSA